MRTLLLTILFCAANAAWAAQSVNLDPRKVVMKGDGSQATLINLTNELRNATSSGKPTAHLVQVDLRVKAAPTGAIFALLVNGAAVASVTVKDDVEQTIHLSADSPSTPVPWVLGVRGDADLRDITVTMDEGGNIPPPKTAPKPAPKNPPPGGPVGPITEPGNDGNPVPPPEQNPGGPVVTPPPANPAPVTPPTNPTEPIKVGQRVVIVSSTSGNIDYAVVIEITPGGRYTVGYQGGQYRGFTRGQVGVIFGCTGSVCVGDRVTSRRRSGRIIARLPAGGLVLEGHGADDRWVERVENVAKAGGKAVPPKGARGNEPVPLPPEDDSGPVRPLEAGADVLWVTPGGQVIPCTIVRAGGNEVSLVSDDGRLHLRAATGDPRIAVTSGCTADHKCVGRRATTIDRAGLRHPVEVIAIQSPTLVVIQFLDMPLDVGNWPSKSLR